MSSSRGAAARQLLADSPPTTDGMPLVRNNLNATLSFLAAAAALGAGVTLAQTAGTPPAAQQAAQSEARRDRDAYGDWRNDAPGVWRHITAGALLPPYSGRVSANSPRVVDPPAQAQPRVPAGFSVTRYAERLDRPRLIRTAPNGDIFVAETAAGRLRILRSAAGAAQAQSITVFADGLDRPFGMAFYPPGPDPQWLYVAQINSVVRFPYHNGDDKAPSTAQTVVAELAGTRGGHTTRDIVFSPDGSRMFVSVGSASNDAESTSTMTPEQIKRWEAGRALGAAWGSETDRADVLIFTPEGVRAGIQATGIRNCVGLAVDPRGHELWCSTNERDALGDDLPPDYLTRVRAGAFYGWPWYYIGDHEDPRHKGERPDLASHITVPDVLVQPHSAPLEMTFYDAPAGPAAFPAEYRGDAFAALHGSWNRAAPTGYKVVRIKLHDGVPTGEYEDFLTGFVLDDDRVWGRPVGVAVAHDGALIVTEDGNGTVWRVAYSGS
jgi:glucose/arabinose dehydrogenase